MESRQLPWVSALRDIYELYDEGIPQYRRGRWKAVFALPTTKELFPGPLQTKFVLQEMLVTKAQAWERVKSKSYIASLSPSDQAVVWQQVEAVLEEFDDEFHLIRTGRDGVERRYARQLIETEVTYALATPAATPPFPA